MTKRTRFKFATSCGKEVVQSYDYKKDGTSSQLWEIFIWDGCLKIRSPAGTCLRNWRQNLFNRWHSSSDWQKFFGRTKYCRLFNCGAIWHSKSTVNSSLLEKQTWRIFGHNSGKSVHPNSPLEAIAKCGHANNNDTSDGLWHSKRGDHSRRQIKMFNVFNWGKKVSADGISAPVGSGTIVHSGEMDKASSWVQGSSSLTGSMLEFEKEKFNLFSWWPKRDKNTWR